jgi:hypothetical protein
MAGCGTRNARQHSRLPQMPHQSTYAGMKWPNQTKLPASSSQWNRRPVRGRLNTVGHSSCSAKRQQDNRARPHPICLVRPVLGAHPWYSKARGPHPNIGLAGYAVVTRQGCRPATGIHALQGHRPMFRAQPFGHRYDMPIATAIKRTPPVEVCVSGSAEPVMVDSAGDTAVTAR